MTDLKPCPFCGGKSKLKRFRSKYALFNVAYYVECSVCKVRTTMTFDPGEPIEAWNLRAREEDKHENYT